MLHLNCLTTSQIHPMFPSLLTPHFLSCCTSLILLSNAQMILFNTCIESEYYSLGAFSISGKDLLSSISNLSVLFSQKRILRSSEFPLTSISKSTSHHLSFVALQEFPGVFEWMSLEFRIYYYRPARRTLYTCRDKQCRTFIIFKYLGEDSWLWTMKVKNGLLLRSCCNECLR